ncbi:hypothetical protein BDV32DRAFT_132469 [Aspergillus pseudonomiae]|nr:hypothetical protein BDV32DRAFT_132469 [Aspergillus pseudonomiae]
MCYFYLHGHAVLYDFVSFFLFFNIISFWWGLRNIVLPADTQLFFSWRHPMCFLSLSGLSVCLLF